jgi:DNA polymerase-1
LSKYKGNKQIDLLLQHSQIAKLYNGFICAFKELPTLPIIHTTFNQVAEDNDDEDDMRGLRTGRLSSCEPNLQQIPARSEDGRKLRNLFVPRQGEAFVVADYSQIELRVAAHFSHDPILVRAFQSGEDVHDATAKALGVERFYGKTGNFLLAFGGYHKRLMDALSISEQSAQEFYDQYWSTFKVLKLWKERMVDLARSRGGVRTLFGRWIPINDLNHSNRWIRGKAERFAISGIVQGSAADIIKLAMLECAAQGFVPVLAVHDELVFERGNNPLFPQALQVDVSFIKHTMENVVKLDIPLVAEIGHGLSWGSAKH